MNPDINLTQLLRKLREAEPDEPRTLMMRAVWNHEVDTRWMEMREELIAAGVKRIELRNNMRINFYPYLQGKEVGRIMYKYWNVTNNKMPFTLPPKFWGLHILIPE